MRVSFDGGRLNERGVAVAMFDYAFHAQVELGIKPVILHDIAIPPEPAHVDRFAAEFVTVAYATEAERQRIIERERVDVAYILKTTRHDLKYFLVAGNRNDRLPLSLRSAHRQSPPTAERFKARVRRA